MRTAIALSALATAVVLAMPPSVLAQAQAQDRSFCLRTPTGALNCTYDTMAQCQQAARSNPSAGGCIARPGTTGRGEMDAPRGSGPNSMDRMPPGTPQR